MSSIVRSASFSALLLAACSRGDEGISSDRAPAVVPAGSAYGGELLLRGDPALSVAGSASIAIVAQGGDAPILARSWDLGDPAWRAAADGRRLYFVLDARDTWPGSSGSVLPEMELVARYDPDGNPATEEQGSVRVRLAVRTGARDLSVELPLVREVVASAPAGTSGGG